MTDAQEGSLLAYAKREIRRGSTSAIILKVIAALLSFLTQLVLTRYLSVDSYGEYIYAMTWVNLCVLLGTQGFTTATVRFLPEYAAKGSYGMLQEYIAHSRRRVVIGSLFMAFVMVVCAFIFASADKSLMNTFLWAGAGIPLLAYLYARAAELRAFKKIIRASLPQEVLRQVLLIAAVIGLIGMEVLAASAANAMLVHIGAIVLMIGLVSLFYRQIRPPAAERLPSSEEQRSVWNHAAQYMLLTAAFNLILTQADILMVGALVGTTEAGIYAVASKLATLVIFILIAVNTIYGPVISGLYMAGDKDLLRSITNYTLTITSAVAAIVAVVLLIFPEELLSLFGAEYVGGESILILLVIAQLTNVIFGPVTLILNMTNHQKVAARILFISMAVNVVLNAVLILYMGEEGAAVATLISMIIWNVWGYAAVRRKVGINTLPFFGSRQARIEE